MSSVVVRFSFPIEREPASVLLSIEDVGDVEMDRPKNAGPSPLTFKASHAIPVPIRFPARFAYSYAPGGSPRLGRALLFHSPPTAPRLRISDGAAAQAPDCFTVRFGIHFSCERGGALLLQADLPVLLGDSKSAIALSRGKGGLWTATARLSVFFPQPLVYKYAVVDSGMALSLREPGRPHLLFIGDPVGGVSVSVFDSWSDRQLGFPYAPRTVSGTVGTIRRPIVTIDFVSRPSWDNVFIKRTSPGLGEPEKMVWDGVWRFERRILANECDFTFAIGCGRPTQWIEPRSFRISGGPSSAIAARYIDASQTYRTFSVYVPLISLTLADEQGIGDFTTLVEFAEWAKRCGIGQIHVHIEYLAGHLIDPVHASVPCQPAERTIDSIRESKIRILIELFNDRAYFPHFEEFRRVFRWIGDRCQSEFAQWTQFFLFRQLADAYRRIADMGIQLVLDFPPAGPISEFFEPLKTWSRCAQTIRLIGMDLYSHPLRRAVIDGFFGLRVADFVAQVLCEQRGDDLVIRDSATDPECRREIFQQIGDPETAEAIDAKFEHFLGYVSIADDHKCRTFLTDNSQLWSSAMILDAEATKFFGPKMVAEEFEMIPSGDALFEGIPFAMMPRHLAPDKVSEFVLETSSAEIRDMIEQRAALPDAMSVTVYLSDLLSGFGDYDRTEPEPIHMRPAHFRFVLGFTVEDLKRDRRLNDRIREFLAASHRLVNRE
jgi:hypothetical protein